MIFDDTESEPSLPEYTAHLDHTGAGPSSQPPSRTPSKVSARPSSRVSSRGDLDGSKSHSNDVERQRYSGRTSKSSLREEDDGHLSMSFY